MGLEKTKEITFINSILIHEQFLMQENVNYQLRKVVLNYKVHRVLPQVTKYRSFIKNIKKIGFILFMNKVCFQ